MATFRHGHNYGTDGEPFSSMAGEARTETGFRMVSQYLQHLVNSHPDIPSEVSDNPEKQPGIIISEMESTLEQVDENFHILIGLLLVGRIGQAMDTLRTIGFLLSDITGSGYHYPVEGLSGPDIVERLEHLYYSATIEHGQVVGTPEQPSS